MVAGVCATASTLVLSLTVALVTGWSFRSTTARTPVASDVPSVPGPWDESEPISARDRAVFLAALRDIDPGLVVNEERAARPAPTTPNTPTHRDVPPRLRTCRPHLPLSRLPMPMRHAIPGRAVPCRLSRSTLAITSRADTPMPGRVFAMPTCPPVPRTCRTRPNCPPLTLIVPRPARQLMPPLSCPAEEPCLTRADRLLSPNHPRPLHAGPSPADVPPPATARRPVPDRPPCPTHARTTCLRLPRPPDIPARPVTTQGLDKPSPRRRALPDRALPTRALPSRADAPSHPWPRLARTARHRPPKGAR
ncbi:hypothetical protein EDD27_3619 [Nonomuraea polychroma]|uniref:Uncharacterized protein n=1 Tax=Nonomuraea polychroma TaxID=46176 RepID=A0A438M5S1_9ACTN|nr:hypothetical protein EDD27_3619 [Nonomuraea polychroma]